MKCFSSIYILSGIRCKNPVYTYRFLTANSPIQKKIGKRSAFSLVEVTMAIGLVSFCLVAMLGVLPLGLAQARKSNDQMLALQALSVVITDFQNAASVSTRTGRYGIEIPVVGDRQQQGNLELDETFSKIDSTKTKQFDVSYRIVPPSSKFSNYQFSVRAVRSSETDVSTKLDKNGMDYVESVILKSAL